MGSDGMRGAEALREAGGLVIAQSEESAEHPSMPGAVARAGAADLVLPLYEIGPVLMDAAFGRELPLPRAELQAIREVFGTNGEIAATARDLDWSLTAIGPVTDWSPVMRSMVRLVMACPDPAVVFWSDELLVLCNDAATRLLGDHERTAFAGPYRDAFPEAWTRAAPIFEQRMHGSPLRVSAVPFRYVREGRMQDAWFDISDTPIWEQDGTVGGHLPPVLRAHGGAAGGTAARDAQRAGPGAARARPPGGAARGPPDPRDHARRRLPAGADRAPAELVGAIGIDSGGAMAPALGRRPRGIGSGTAFTVWMPPTRSPAGWRTRTPTRSSPSSRSGRTTAAARRREPRPGLRDLRVARRGERRAPRGDPVQRGRPRRDCAPN